MLQLKDNKLSIWMEDKCSKKQWRKNDMVMGDYVTSANMVIGASALNYLQEALDCKLDKHDDVQRIGQESLEDRTLCLSFLFKFQFLSSRKEAKFTFTLDPVELERIDVLESKLRDQQEELKRLRARDVEFARFEASTKDTNTQKLLWSTVESKFCHVVRGEIKFYQSGVYSVGAVVNSIPQNDGNVALLKNTECIQKAACSNSTTLSSVLQLERGDTVSVQCDGDVGNTCYLTIAQLGYSYSMEN
ncbi:hypothetical protein DVH05_004955 [Phytophthora capsici]|nr:hypothetical protein DVH05_004955 [Phytophthora capsici]